MNWTNNYNLPDDIIKLLPKMYQPKRDRFSITQLIDAPRIRTLQIEKWDNIVRDYSELISTLHGIAMHERNERFANDDEDVEHKLEDVVDGITVVGKADVFQRLDARGEKGVIKDTKNVAMGALEFESRIKDFIAQTNCYAWQRRKHNIKVEAILLDIFYRDWKLRDYERSSYKLYKIHRVVKSGEIVKGYPPCGYTRIELPLWSFEQQEQYIHDQIQYHVMSAYDCSDEARWKSKTKFAIMQKGKKKAIMASEMIGEERVPFYSLQRIEQAAKEKHLVLGDKNYIETRPGKCTRCESYCNVRSVCKHVKQ